MNTVQETVANIKGIPTREQLLEMLHKEVVEVTFTKLDGEERVMPCTLIESYIDNPAKTKDESNKVRQVSDKVVAVWAIESKGFRSFRYDRVKSIKVLEYGANY
jgi:hypothetical protein